MSTPTISLVQITDYAFSEGNGRITLFASSGNARTFNFQPGDIGTNPF